MLCCGVNGESDYSKHRLFVSYPGSCCSKPVTEYCSDINEVYKTGCGDALFATIDKYITIVSIVAIVICGVEVSAHQIFFLYINIYVIFFFIVTWSHICYLPFEKEIRYLYFIIYGLIKNKINLYYSSPCLGLVFERNH